MKLNERRRQLERQNTWQQAKLARLSSDLLQAEKREPEIAFGTRQRGSLFVHLQYLTSGLYSNLLQSLM